MSNLYTDGSYLTQKGNILIAKLLASKGQLIYTKATVGSGMIPDGMTPGTMTELSHYEMDGMIAAIDNPVDGEAAVIVQVFSTGLAQGFNATEIALWALDPDEGEIVHTFLSLAQHPEWIRPESGSVLKLATFNLITIVGSLSATAVIHPEAFARAVDLAKYSLIGHTHQPEDIIGLVEWRILTTEELNARISHLESMLLANITENAFLAQFADLDGLAVDGVWNQTLERIEF